MRLAVRVTSRAAFVAFLVALAQAGSAAAEGRCQLLVISRPAGGTVYLDGEERGEIPLTLTGFDVGRHEIKVVLEGHYDWTKRVQLRPGGNTVEAKLEEKAAPAPEPEEGEGKAPTKEGGERGEAGAGEPDEGGVADKLPADEAAADGEDGKVPRLIPAPCPCCEGKGVIDKIGCVTCDATGYDGYVPCVNCRNTGRKPARCLSCLGQGTLVAGGKEAKCPSCNGKGGVACPLCRRRGTILRPNPEAAGYPTTPCLDCSGTGAEEREKCRRCGGRGTIEAASAVTVLWATCPHCGGDGVGPPMCMRCRGRGFRRRVRTQEAVVPCGFCSGRGRLFPPCRTCRGAGWHRAR